MGLHTAQVHNRKASECVAVGWSRFAVRFPATATTPDLAFTGMRSVRAWRGYSSMRDPLRLHHRNRRELHRSLGTALVAAGAALVAGAPQHEATCGRLIEDQKAQR